MGISGFRAVHDALLQFRCQPPVGVGVHVNVGHAAPQPLIGHIAHIGQSHKPAVFMVGNIRQGVRVLQRRQIGFLSLINQPGAEIFKFISVTAVLQYENRRVPQSILICQLHVSVQDAVKVQRLFRSHFQQALRQPVRGRFMSSAPGVLCLGDQRPEGIRGDLRDSGPVLFRFPRSLQLISGQKRGGGILPEMDVQAQAGALTGTVGITLPPAVFPLVTAVPFQIRYLLRGKLFSDPAEIESIESVVDQSYRAINRNDFFAYLGPILLRGGKGVPGILLRLEFSQGTHNPSQVFFLPFLVRRLQRDGPVRNIPVDDVNLEGAVQPQFYGFTHRT